jgi:cell division septum initiation protein DivIVA
MADDEGRRAEQGDVVPPPVEGGGFAELRGRVPSAIRDVSFPSAARGYERRAVDSYVSQVNRLIAELEVGRSPEAAVRHALDKVGEQTTSILQQARESAEQIAASAGEEADEVIARARAEADEMMARAKAAHAEAEEIIVTARAEADAILARAKADAEDIIARSHAEAESALDRSRAEAAERLRRVEDEIGASREQAEARMQELHAETEAVWKQRHELLDEIHAMGTRLLEVASGAAARLSPTEPSGNVEPEAAAAPETDSSQPRQRPRSAAN